MKAFLTALAIIAGFLATASKGHAQPISYTGGALAENFDSMGAAGTTTPTGWFVGWHNGYPPGTAGTVFSTNSVTVNSGTTAPDGTIAAFNCGTNDATAGLDRSLGTGPTTPSSPDGTNRFIGVQIQNNSGETLKAINVTYVGKQWRTSSSTNGQAFTTYLQYGTDGADFVFMGLAFDFKSPVTGPASTPLNGNLPANSVADLGGDFALPSPLPPGGTIYLRWLEVDNPSTDPVLAIDNFTFRGFTNVPEIVIDNSDFGYTFSVFAGKTGVSGANNGTGTAARFNALHALAADRQGNLYVADSGNQLIRKITPLGEVTTLAGQTGVAGTNNGTGANARFNVPQGICVDTNGNVFVSEVGNNTIRKITPAGVVSTVAGLAGISGSSDGNGSAARFNGPVTVSVDDQGFLYVGDTFNHTIRKITPAGDVSTLAGVAGVTGTRNGPATNALFNGPHTCLPDGRGNVYVAEWFNSAIRKISADGIVSTFAGSPGNFGTNDGVGTFARLHGPWGLRFEASGNLLVIDQQNSAIRRIAPNGTVKTIAGVVGVAGSADGRGTSANFALPRGIALDPTGKLFVADAANNTIRIGQPDPSLQASRSNGQVIISWAAWTTNYQLESSAFLPATNWTPVAASPVFAGDRKFVTNSSPLDALFFRLRNP